MKNSYILGCLTLINRIIIFMVCSFQGTISDPFCFSGSSGDKGIRTLDPLLARQVLSQLSYTPI